MREWLLTLPKPIGIFGATDLQAIRLIQVCRDIGLSIPRDVAVLGVGNDTMLCNIQTPSLSSIDPNAQRIGYLAAELMAKRLKVKTFRTNETIFVPPFGVVQRKTTDILAVDDPEIVAAIKYIRDHACESIKVMDVVDAVGLSYSTLLRRFSSTFGLAPDEAITNIRIDRAKKLLQETSLSTASVGKRVGFQYPQHFARVFRQLVGMSPSKYRDQLVSSNEW